MAAATMVLAKRASSTAWLHEKVNSKLPFIMLNARKVDALVALNGACLADARLAKQVDQHHDVVLRQISVFRYSKASAWMLLCLDTSMPLRRTFSHTPPARAAVQAVDLTRASCQRRNAEPPV